MKRQVLVAIVCLFSLFTYAQGPEPVKWKFYSKRTNNDLFSVYAIANINHGWHIYSQTSASGPGPTIFKFQKKSALKLRGGVKEMGNLQVQYDSVFHSSVKLFTEKVDFVQLVEIKNDTVTSINGSVVFLACNGRECLPPKEVFFSISLR